MDAIYEPIPAFYTFVLFSPTIPYERLKRSLLEKKIDLKEKGFEYDWWDVFDLKDLDLKTLKIKNRGDKIRGYTLEKGVLKTAVKKGPFNFGVLVYPHLEMSKIEGTYEDITSKDADVLDKDRKNLQNITSIELNMGCIAGPY